MRTLASLLHRMAVAESSSSLAPGSTPEQTAPAMAVDSNMVVILASLLCAVICVTGLALVSWCTCRRRNTSSSSDHSPPPKGLKKKAIDALPTVCFAATHSPLRSSSSASPVAGLASSECAICLAEFADGERLRMLPQCGHGFHVGCIDAWLRTHATCPSCRASIFSVESAKPILVPAAPTVVVVVADGASRCQRCGDVAAPTSGGDTMFLP